LTPDLWIPQDAPDAAVDRLGSLATLHRFPSEGAIVSSLGHADILVAGHQQRRALEVAEHLDGLRVIQSFSAGVDAIVGKTPPGVVLCDASGVHDVPMAEWVVMTILASIRRLPEYLDAQRSGSWLAERRTGDDLEGATVVLVGAGSIGRAVETRLAPFGVRFVRITRQAREGSLTLDELPGILPDADVVVVLLPLTAQTRQVFGAELIGRMRPGALLVSASRGGVVDTDALTAAVLEGRIRVALDVTDPEPLPDGHPLWSAPGVLITPHIGSDVRRDDERAWTFVAEQVARYARGEPLLNVVADGY
jgi:phosphoglycerate dehydrogenase-like enzyme